MKPWLLYPERDFITDWKPARHGWHSTAVLRDRLEPFEKDLLQDLEMNTVLSAMAANDPLIAGVCRLSMLDGANLDLATIQYRQEILRDCLHQAEVIRQLYQLTGETLEREHAQNSGLLSMNSPVSVLSDAVKSMNVFVEALRSLRDLTGQHAERFHSPGLKALCARLQAELPDAYLMQLHQLLKELKFTRGVLLSGEIGEGGHLINLTLRRHSTEGRWWNRWFSFGQPSYTIHLAERDEAGARIMSELRGRGLNQAANILALSVSHIMRFFIALRTELAFYVGCLNLRDALAARHIPVCVPHTTAAGTNRLHCEHLYDISLALSTHTSVVSNTVLADNRTGIIVTGTNQGGKSSFLRSMGAALLMMQCGMCVAASSFTSDSMSGVYTHFKREEDQTLKSGKLDEELMRLSALVDVIQPNALLLMNESFASTNEREGSEIAYQVFRGLVDKRIRVIYVTHLFEFARRILEERNLSILFLCAERLPDGARSFRIIEGEPQSTSYGQDLYEAIFHPQDNGLQLIQPD